MSRAALYQANSGRAGAQAKFADYSEYLDWLEMTAEIAPFKPVYMARIAQLTNKTNQFNLTTRRYTQAEIEAMARDPRYIGLYGRLTDRFGDNGLISLVLGRREDDVLHLDLWLMSCRVLKREMELAMLDALVEHARAAGMRTLRGYYIPTKKNALAAEHYLRMGFTNTALDAETGMTTWDLSISGYTSRSRHIRVLDPVVL
jgi:FkbH-like protein